MYAMYTRNIKCMVTCMYMYVDHVCTCCESKCVDENNSRPSSKIHPHSYVGWLSISLDYRRKR